MTIEYFNNFDYVLDHKILTEVATNDRQWEYFYLSFFITIDGSIKSLVTGDCGRNSTFLGYC